MTAMARQYAAVCITPAYRKSGRKWDEVVSNHHPPVFQTGAQTAYAIVPQAAPAGVDPAALP